MQARCAGSTPDVSPFGVDSVFKLGSVNFNPDLYDPEGEMLGMILDIAVWRLVQDTQRGTPL